MMSAFATKADMLNDIYRSALGQSRRFALQKNSEAYRGQGTVKSVTDLPIGREPRSYLDSDQNFLTSRNTVLKL